MTGNYYAHPIKKLREEIKSKRRGIVSSDVSLLDDNASSHKCNIPTTAVQKSGFQVVMHPLYSPDLAPTDYHLFARLKKQLRGVIFHSDEELINAVQHYFDAQPPSFFEAGMSQLEIHWLKVISMKGLYIE